MRSEVLGSVNALTTSHKEIFTSMNQYSPSIGSSHVSSISNSEHMNCENNDLHRLILQLRNKIDKIKYLIAHEYRPLHTSYRVIANEEIQITTAGLIEHVRIEAPSAKYQHLGTNLMYF